MPGRFAGPVGKQFSGDRQAAMDLQGRARILVQSLFDSINAPPFNGKGSMHRDWRMPDGTVIHAYVQTLGAAPIVRTWIESPRSSLQRDYILLSGNPLVAVASLGTGAFYRSITGPVAYGTFRASDLSDLKVFEQKPTGFFDAVPTTTTRWPAELPFPLSQDFIQSKNQGDLGLFKADWTVSGTSATATFSVGPFSSSVSFEDTNSGGNYEAQGSYELPRNVLTNLNNMFVAVIRPGNDKVVVYTNSGDFLYNINVGSIYAIYPSGDGFYLVSSSAPFYDEMVWLYKIKASSAGAPEIVWYRTVSNSYDFLTPTGTPPRLPGATTDNNFFASLAVYDFGELAIEFIDSISGDLVHSLHLDDAAMVSGNVTPISMILHDGKMLISLQPMGVNSAFDMTRGRIDVYAPAPGEHIPTVLEASIPWSTIKNTLGADSNSMVYFIQDVFSSFIDTGFVRDSLVYGDIGNYSYGDAS